MKRLAVFLACASAAGLSLAALAGLPGLAMAFELETGAATVPGGTAQFGDPDETPLPAPLSTPKLEVDGTAAMATSKFGNPADNSALIPTPGGDMPFWTYSGVPAQRFGD